MVKVLIALDEDPVSMRAARVAVRLFGEHADFFVVNVSPVPVPWVGAAGFGTVAPLVMDPRWVDADVGDPIDDEDERNLMARAEEAGVPEPHVVLRAGDAVTELCSAADEHEVDVVVVGSHDKSALRRLLDPSVAAAVVHDTYRPVLVVSGAPPSGQ